MKLAFIYFFIATILLAVILFIFFFQSLFFSFNKKSLGSSPVPTVFTTHSINNSAPGFMSKEFSVKNWKTYVNVTYGYSIDYPADFTLEDRGKIGTIENLTAFNGIDNGRKFTVVKLEVHPEKPSSAKAIKEEGKDADNNVVITYTIPLNNKSLLLIGTAYPVFGGTSHFNKVIAHIAETFKTK